MAKTIFYNPKVGALGIDVSIVSNSIQLELGKAINPSASGRPAAGAKVYDWDNKAFFSLTPDECARIDANLNQILDGTYKNVEASDPKYQHIFPLTHFRENQASRFSIQKTGDIQGKPVNSITIGIVPPGAPALYYPLRPEEMLIWRWFIKSGYQRLPYESAFNDALGKKERKEAWDKKNAANGGQPSSGQSYKQHNSAPPQDDGPGFGDPGPSQSYDAPPQPTPPASSSSSPIDFDF